MMKRLLLVLLLLAPMPAFAQYWGVPGSAGDIDDAAATLFDTDGPTLKFKSGQTGTIVARYPVFSPVQDPGWTTLAVNYTGAGVNVKLIRLLYCQKFTNQLLSASMPAGESNSCEGATVPAASWDFSQWTYYVEVALTRSSTATDPQVHQLHFQ
jgi:hypothetical protein